MFCPNCGKEIKDAVKFCPGCGKTVTVQEDKMVENAFSKSDKSKKRTVKVVSVVLLLVALIATGIFAGVYYYQLPEKSPANNSSSNDEWYLSKKVTFTQFKYGDSSRKYKDEIVYRKDGQFEEKLHDDEKIKFKYDNTGKLVFFSVDDGEVDNEYEKGTATTFNISYTERDGEFYGVSNTHDFMRFEIVYDKNNCLISVEAYYEDEITDYIKKEHYDDGTLSKFSKFDEGFFETTEYDNDGQKLKYSWSSDVTSGETTFRNGKMYNSVVYQNNKLEWRIVLEENDEQGVKCVKYDENGKVISSSQYYYDKSGNILKSETFDLDGNKIETETYTYDDNGNILTSDFWNSDGCTVHTVQTWRKK